MLFNQAVGRGSIAQKTKMMRAHNEQVDQYIVRMVRRTIWRLRKLTGLS